MHSSPPSAIVSLMRSYHSSSLRKGRNSEAGRIYMITTSCADRLPILASDVFARMVAHEIQLRSTERLCENLCYVVMPDHVHWLLQLMPDSDLSNVVARTKGRSARRINHTNHPSLKIWQSGFHDHAVRKEEDLENLANYTMLNPVRAGLVSHAEDYPHWWSRWHPRVRG